jgi:hypothetical protein
MNMKVVDLAIPYNFRKGHIVFFSIDFAGEAFQPLMPLCVSEQEVLSVDQVFSPFSPPNLKCQST